MRRFAEQVVIVTGAASGIGRATARRFAEEGARLVLADLNTDGLVALADALDADVLVQATDVGDRHQVERLIDATMDRFDRIEVLCNNAGIGGYGPTPDLDPDDWHRMIAVDLDSVFYATRVAIPHLRAGGGGTIVNTASISGLYGDYGLAAYCAAKGAVVNYTRAVAIDHASEGIRCNCVCPGAIETALTEPILGIERFASGYEELIPMGRVGQAEEIAGAVAFLASDDASYITGHALVIDGGVTAATGQINFTRLLEAG